MKNVTIVSTNTLKAVHGANYVLCNFVKSKKYFRNIHLRAIISPNEDVSIDREENMPLGEGMNSIAYKGTIKIRGILRKMLSSEYFIGAYIKEYFNYILPATLLSKKISKECSDDDIILFQDLYAAYYYFKGNRGNRVKTAAIIHEADDSMGQLFLTFPFFNKPEHRNHLLKIRDLAYQNLDTIIYISEKAYNSSIAPMDKRRMIYNGIPDINDSLRSVNNHHDIINLVCVGSMSGRKGQELILRAISLLGDSIRNNLKLYLVGDGGERCNLEKLTQDLGLQNRVTFTGVRKDVDVILSTMDVFIMPSSNEGLSISTLEALRAGLYLLLTDTGGNCEVMGDNCGMVINRDPIDIKNKIEHIILNNIINNTQKSLSVARYKQLFSLEVMAKKYDEVLGKL